MLALCFKPDRSRLHHAILALVLTHLLAVMALAALPKVHEWVHSHNHDPTHAHSHDHTHGHSHEHECAVTQFLHGGYMASAAAIFVIGVAAWTTFSFIRPRFLWVENLFLSGSILEHAPPAR